MTKNHGDEMHSRDQPVRGVQFFYVLFHVLGQIRRLVLGEDAQQRAQLQPPVLQWDTMPINYKAKLSEAIAAACMQ